MIKLILAFCVGSVIALCVLLAAMPPTADDMERAAGDLMPSDADVEQLGASRGHPIIVGWDRWVGGDFTVDRPWPEVRSDLEARASELGWQVADVRPIEQRPGAVIELWRPLMTARIRVVENTRRTAAPDTTFSSVSIRRNAEMRTPIFWLLVIAGRVGTALFARRWT
jgi:hypothetical protein